MNYENLILRNLSEEFGPKGYIKEKAQFGPVSGIAIEGGKEIGKKIEEELKRYFPDGQIIYSRNKDLENYFKEELGFEVEVVKRIEDFYLISAKRTEPTGLGKPDAERRYTLVVALKNLETEGLGEIRITHLYIDPRD